MASEPLIPGRWVQIYRPSFWQRIMLWFRPTLYALDGNCWLRYKSLYGRVYVLGTEWAERGLL